MSSATTHRLKVLRQEYEDLMKQGRIHTAHLILDEYTLVLMQAKLA